MYNLKQDRARENGEQVRPMLYHAQIPSSRTRNTIYTLYEMGEKTLSWFKLMRLTQEQYNTIMPLCAQRARSFRLISELRQAGFAGGEQCDGQIVFQKQERQQEINLLIKQPFLRGVNLAEYIRQLNLEYALEAPSNSNHKQERWEFIVKLIRNLADILIRVKREAWVIPTFRNIMVDPASQTISINLFSFTGVPFLTGNQPLQEDELREVLPFLDTRVLSTQGGFINMQRALAVLVLGVLVGKQLNLVTGTMARERNPVTALVNKNAEKFKKILGSKQVNSLIEDFEKCSKMRLKEFFTATLVQQQEMSWGKCLRYLEPGNIDPTHGILSQDSARMLRIRKWIAEYAWFLWLSLTGEQQKQFISNGMLDNFKEDYKVFLMYYRKMGYSKLQKITQQAPALNDQAHSLLNSLSNFDTEVDLLETNTNFSLQSYAQNLEEETHCQQEVSDKQQHSGLSLKSQKNESDQFTDQFIPQSFLQTLEQWCRSGKEVAVLDLARIKDQLIRKLLFIYREFHTHRFKLSNTGFSYKLQSPQLRTLWQYQHKCMILK